MTIAEFFTQHPEVTTDEIARLTEIEPEAMERYRARKQPGRLRFKLIQNAINSLGGMYAKIKIEGYKPILFESRPLNDEERAQFRGLFIKAVKQYINHGRICSSKSTSNTLT